MIFQSGAIQDSFPAFGPFCLASGKRKKTSAAKHSTGKGASTPLRGTRTVLILGGQPELSLYRAEVLRARGFRVLTPSDERAAINAVRQGDFDAAVITYTLNSAVVEELAELLQQHAPDCPVVTISRSGTTDPRVAAQKTVSAQDGPAGLIQALQEVLHSK